MSRSKPKTEYDKLKEIWYGKLKKSGFEDIERDENTLKEYSSWIFNENICEFEPPIPQPIDGKNYFWDENNIKWVENPDYPTDGLNYSFDYNSMKWVKI